MFLTYIFFCHPCISKESNILNYYIVNDFNVTKKNMADYNQHLLHYASRWRCLSERWTHFLSMHSISFSYLHFFNFAFFSVSSKKKLAVKVETISSGKKPYGMHSPQKLPNSAFLKVSTNSFAKVLLTFQKISKINFNFFSDTEVTFSGFWRKKPRQGCQNCNRLVERKVSGGN